MDITNINMKHQDFLKTYPDGTSYYDLSTAVATTEVVFRLNTYTDLWQLNQFVDAWNHTYVVPPTIIIPNLLDAQADRRFNAQQSSGLKLVCKFLNNLNAHFKIFHPHNAEVVEALMDNVTIIDNTTFIIKVLTNLQEGKYISCEPGGENLILMSSDAGGFKPLMKLCDNIDWVGETFSANKARKYENGKTTLTQTINREDFQGRNILLIDDICVYGGTFKGLAKLLKKRNCGKLYLATSHMTVARPDKELFSLFDKVFSTNSKGLHYLVDDINDDETPWYTPQNLEIIKLF